jgi:hypothetical protein
MQPNQTHVGESPRETAPRPEPRLGNQRRDLLVNQKPLESRQTKIKNTAPRFATTNCNKLKQTNQDGAPKHPGQNPELTTRDEVF